MWWVLFARQIVVYDVYSKQFVLHVDNVSSYEEGEKAIDRLLDFSPQGNVGLEFFHPFKVNEKILKQRRILVSRLKKQLRLYRKNRKKFPHLLTFKLSEQEVVSIVGFEKASLMKKAFQSIDVPLDATLNRTQTIKVSLHQKVDGAWFRLAVPVPPGWRVRAIRREDGRLIKNEYYGDRINGVKVERNWWIENGYLYFIDDPINGYDITLSPPAPSNSLLVEVPYEDDEHAGGLSAIIFPYNGGTPDSNDDHTGGTYDGGLGNNIDDLAGAKVAIKIGGTQWGNEYGDTTPLGNYRIVLAGRDYIDINTTPKGDVESVIVTNLTLDGNSDVFLQQKLIIRNNNMWIGDIFYVKNVGTSTLSNLKFFQGIDWNFQGSYSGDNSYYDSATDTNYGAKSSSGLSYGGFKGYYHSVEHDCTSFSGVWSDIRNNNLNNANSYSGDAAGAQAWTKASLDPGEVWVIPIIWGLGFNKTHMDENIADGINSVFDVGINSIDAPDNDTYLNPLSTPVVQINATAALYGLVDQFDMPVYVKIEGPSGFTTVDTQAGTVDLEVPYKETAPVTYSWDISSVPTGDYNITFYTSLANDTDASNDSKTITVHVVKVTLEPQVSIRTVDPGSTAYHQFTIFNGGLNDTFEIYPGASTQGWASYLYYNSTLVAYDLDGNGAWDWTNSTYNSDNDPYPEIFVESGSNATFQVSKVVPPEAERGSADYTNITIVSVSDSAVSRTSTLETRVTPPGTVTKELYLHSGGQMNRTEPTVASSNTSIAAYDAIFWQQSPVFAGEFHILSAVNVPLYIDTGGSTASITVSIFYTDGTSSTAVGYATLDVNSDASSATVFNIPLDDEYYVPAGQYFLLKIKNNSGNPITVCHDASRRSRVEFLTTDTYVYTEWVATYNSNGVATGSFPPSTTVKVKAKVEDPFGTYDINATYVKLYYENGTAVWDWTPMSIVDEDTSSPPFWRIYYYAFASPSETGNYTLSVRAEEGNGVVYEKNLTISVELNPDHIEIFPEGSTALVGESKNLTVRVVDSGGVVVPYSTYVTITVSGNATIVDTTLSSASGVGSNTVSGYTSPSGTALISVYDNSSEIVRVSPDSSLSGSTASPDRDEDANIYFVSSAVNKEFYLKDDGSGSSSDPDDLMDTDPPTGTVSDYDGDGNPGTALYSGGYDPAHPTQFQEFVGIANFTDTFNIRGAELHIWSYSDSEASIDLVAEIYDYDGSSYSLVASGSFAQTWHTSWAEDVIDFGPLNYDFPANHTLVLRLYRNDASSAVLNLGYDDSTYRSFLKVYTPTFIVVESVDFYDAAYPNGASRTYFEPGDDVYIRAKVKDPLWGYGDISSANLTCDSLGLSDAVMNPVDNYTGYTVFEYLVSSSPAGEHQVWIKGIEKNGVFVVNYDNYTCGPDHIRVMADDGLAPTGGNETLVIRLEDSYNNPVSGSFQITVSVNGSAVIVDTTLLSPSGLGTGTVTGYTTADGNATVTISDALAEVVTVVPDGSFPGSGATPDRDVPDDVKFSGPSLQTTKEVMNVSTGSSYADTVSAKPGERVRYRITITNIGDDNATNIVIVDPLPADMEYVSGSMTIDYGGGATALTDAADSDEGDWNVSNPGAITISISSLEPSSSVVITWEAVVK